MGFDTCQSLTLRVTRGHTNGQDRQYFRSVAHKSRTYFISHVSTKENQEFSSHNLNTASAFLSAGYMDTNNRQSYTEDPTGETFSKNNYNRQRSKPPTHNLQPIPPYATPSQTHNNSPSSNSNTPTLLPQQDPAMTPGSQNCTLSKTLDTQRARSASKTVSTQVIQSQAPSDISKHTHFPAPPTPQKVNRI